MEIGSAALDSLLNFMYSGSIEIPTVEEQRLRYPESPVLTSMSLYHASDRYLVGGLREFYEKTVHDHLDIATAPRLMTLAKKMRFPHLKKIVGIYSFTFT